jgi:general secretion pathway protein L
MDGDLLGAALVEKGKIVALQEGAFKPRFASSTQRVIAIVPGQDVTSFAVPIPVSKASQVRKAAGFLIEDRLAVPLQQVHFSIGGQTAEGRQIAVVARDRMASWLGALSRHGLKPDAMVADHQVYREVADGAGLIEHATGISLVQHGEAVSLDRSAAMMFAEQWLDGKKPVTVMTDHQGLIELARGRGWAHRSAPTLSQDLTTMAPAAAAAADRLNLLQGDYNQSLGWFDDFGYWKVACGVWVMAGLAYAGLIAAEAWLLDRRAQSNQTQIEAIAGELLPGQRLVDPRRQLLALTGTSQAADQDFQRLSAALLEAMGKTTMDGETPVVLDAIRYDASTRALAATVSYGDYAHLANLRDALNGYGVRMREGSAREQAGRMLGEVTLSWR